MIEIESDKISKKSGMITARYKGELIMSEFYFSKKDRKNLLSKLEHILTHKNEKTNNIIHNCKLNCDCRTDMV